ncbi:unnamed protein product [Caenorhabditis angaria]|uniref:Uncharacterized protein n=1 Tax=Caenorhabditis angaria TaxID=860376 RepID=A0A9P1IYU3_9PELO|nr:unnamed protein product [Caenorhabditis angaria]
MNVSVNLSKNARQIQEDQEPDKKLSWFSKLFEFSISELLGKCRKAQEPIEIDDLPPLEDDNYLAHIMKGYKWKRRVIGSILLRFWKSFVIAFAFRISAIFADYASILLLKYLIDSAEISATLSSFFIISILILFFIQLKSLLFGVHTYLVAEDTARISAVLNTIIVKKALFLTSSITPYTSLKIQKLVTTHSDAISNALLFVHHSWASMLELIIAIFWIWETLGTRTIIAVLIVAVVYLFLNVIDSWIYKKSLKQQVKLRDERVEFSKTVLSSMETIKLFAWESEFGEKLHKIRKEELGTFRKTSWINCCMHSLNITSPFVIMFVSFAVYGLSFKISDLRFEDAFVLIAIFNYMRRPLHTIMPSLDYLNRAFHSATRINQFITAQNSPNKPSDRLSKKAQSQVIEHEYDVKLEDANFSWNGSSDDLKNITLEVLKGEIHGIVGFPLCGKSSLLCAIVGELQLTKGKRWVSPRISFAPSIPFLFSQTVKANILFGNEFDKVKYDKVINVCDLRKDIFSFPRCDATMLGDRGYVLTETQKAQISLARCIYQDADIYALDKAFCLMDLVTERKVFEKVLGKDGFLRGKTVILATNNIRLTKGFTKNHVMKDGKLEISGTYDDIIERSTIMSELLSISETDDRIEERFIEIPKKKKGVMFDVDKMSLKKKKPVIIISEAIEVRKRNTYLYYFRNCSYLFFGLYMVFLVTRFVLQSLAFFWLSFWLDPQWKKEECENCPQYVFLQLMSFFAISAVISNTFAYVFSVMTTIDASKKLHDHIIRSILNAPMPFFTKSHNVEEFIQLFTGDLDIADTQFPMYIKSFLETSLNILMIFSIVAVNLPIYLVFVVAFFIFIFALLKLYIPTSHKIIHLENIQKSQFLCYVSQNFDTRLMARVFDKTKTTLSEISEISDVLTRCKMAKHSALRWLSLRIELMSNIIIFSCFIVAAICRNFHMIENAGFALCVASILSITELVSTFIRVICTLESYSPNIQKICHTKNYPKEHVIDSTPMRDSWPDSGNIDIENLNVFANKYKHILKGINLSIQSLEKVGIVGKPGAGKTQLALTLVAMTSADDESRIFIDGVNVYDIGVNTLRSRVTVIPQKARIFADTLRNNIDPCGQFADSDVWLAIESCQMKDFVKGLTHGLNQPISADLMSEEQKEQINVCRAILKGGQIFVIDQSTKFMNEPTKSLVEHAIRENLKQSTLIVIGEEFHDVENCDRIFVIENGQIVNVDTSINMIKKFGTLQNCLLECAL